MSYWPRFPDCQTTRKALAALYSRFAPGRKLHSLGDWKELWSQFPEAHFRSAHVPYTGPNPFKDDIGGFFLATIIVELPDAERLYIQLALSVAMDTARFEGLLRGVTREDLGCKVLDVRCVLKDGKPLVY